jgi:hypothetical protein
MTMMTVNGVRLAYEISGTGDIPLIMVHGGLSPGGPGIGLFRTWQIRFAFSPMTNVGTVRASGRADRAASASMSLILPP